MWRGLLCVVLASCLAVSSGKLGTTAPLGTEPHHAAIFSVTEYWLDGSLQYTFLCSGAVVHQQFILTTADCVDDWKETEIAVAAGFVNLTDDNIDYINATEVIKHFAYVEGDQANDIALIKISSGLISSPSLSILAIREVDAAPGTPCVISGWRTDLITLSPALMHSNISLLEKANCSQLVAGEICAGSPYQPDEICQLIGDEGSPISCGGLLTGVMHYSTETCISDPEPGVFGDVVWHKDWINSYIKPSSSPANTQNEKLVSPKEVGTVAPLGMAPHHAAVFSMQWIPWGGGYTQYTFLCSGAVVNSEFVLTTAYCLIGYSYDEIAVAAGFVDMYDTDMINYINATELVRHFMYVSGEKDNDIALIKLSPGFSSSANLSPLAIREADAAVGTSCTVTGWRTDVLTVNDVLLHSNVSVLNKVNCTNLINGQVCAGAPYDPDLICQLIGEEGSPLNCDNLLTGLMDYSYDPCISDPEPGVFTDVVWHKDWINSYIKPSGSPENTQNEKLVSRTEVGTVAPLGMAPHHAAVFSMQWIPWGGGYTQYTFLCSGAVVHSEFVLTTAYCLTGFSYDEIAVAAGFVDMSDTDTIVYINATELIKHVGYIEGEKGNDVALIKLSPGFSSSENLSPLAIREADAAVGTSCTVTGWRTDMLTVNDVLLHSNISVLTKGNCTQLIDGQICAGATYDPDLICQLIGDEGSPLNCDGLLTGIMHYSYDPCISDPEPGLFLDIVSYKDWIISYTGSTSTSTSTTSEATTTTEGHPTGEIDGGGAGSVTGSVLALVVALCVAFKNMN